MVTAVKKRSETFTETSSTASVGQFAILGAPDVEHWERFVQEHPKGTIFHTPAMVEVFRATKQYHPLVLAAIDTKGEMLALLVAVRIDTLPLPDPLAGFSSRSIWYAEPLCRDDDLGVAALTALIAVHDAKMKHRVLFTEVRPIYEAGMERIALERCGYSYLGYLNYVIDLTQPLDQLWENISKSCRKDIRRTQKRSVRVEEITTEEGLDLLYPFLQLSYNRTRVPLADKSLFDAALQTLKPHDMVKIYVVYHEDTPVAAAIMLIYKQLLYAWYAGMERVKSITPAECLHWHKIEWGHKNNFALYDFGGAGWPDKPYGVRDFKAKFGGALVNYGRYRKVYYPWKFEFAEKLYELGRSAISSWRELMKKWRAQPEESPAAE